MKYLADTHMHSIYSYDGQMRLDDIVKRAIELNLKYVAITEHLELDSITYKQFLNRYKLYSEDIDRLNDEQRSITILKGVEISNPNRHLNELESIQELDIDYIIGSNHDLTKSPLEYYQEIFNIVKSGLIDTLGHIDYLRRKYDHEIPYYLINQIYEEMVKNNIVLEVNSSAKRRINGISFPEDELLNLYLSKYSKNITIGSDAHRLNEIYDNISEIDDSIDANKGVFIKRRFISLTKK